MRAVVKSVYDRVFDAKEVKGMERILVINPGSTSTKLAVFDADKELFRLSIEHDQRETAKFLRAIDQLDFRKECVLNALKEHDIPLESLSCIVSRGGMLPPCQTGAYDVNADMLRFVNSDHLVKEHISNVGCAVAHAIAEPLNIPALIYDTVSVDELIPEARITGVPELPKESRGHALNTRAMARKCAEEILHKDFDKCTFIVLHLGGGVSTWLFQNGRAIDMYSDDDSGFGPERCGRLQAAPLVALCYSGKYTEAQLAKLVRGNAGLKAHLGTSDVREVERMIAGGDEHARLIFSALGYSLAKGIGDLATVVSGKVDRIILTGGAAHSKALTGNIISHVEWIAPVEVMAGEYELEALASGALRVLRGEEKPHTFGWNG